MLRKRAKRGAWCRRRCALRAPHRTRPVACTFLLLTTPARGAEELLQCSSEKITQSIASFLERIAEATQDCESAADRAEVHDQRSVISTLADVDRVALSAPSHLR